MSEPPADAYLAERIRSALAQDPRVNELGIQVVIVGGRAVVTGSVATAERKDGIASVIHEQFPALTVQNDVTVQDVGARPAVETIT
jgi:osmotically-inducible protein OsmY